MLRRWAESNRNRWAEWPELARWSNIDSIPLWFRPFQLVFQLLDVWCPTVTRGLRLRPLLKFHRLHLGYETRPVIWCLVILISYFANTFQKMTKWLTVQLCSRSKSKTSLKCGCWWRLAQLRHPALQNMASWDEDWLADTEQHSVRITETKRLP